MSDLPSSNRQGQSTRVFHRKDADGIGRICMMASAGILVQLIGNLTGGSLYTAFLTIHNFSIVDVGIISFLPLLASCFGIFSPLILERFQKRKWILALGRLAYYTLNILGTTILPFVAKNQQQALIGFGAIVFLGGVINHLFGSGYTVWHLNFIKEPVRARYFSTLQIISAATSSATLMGLGVLTDALQDTPYFGTVLTVMRLIGYGLALLDIVVLLIPKEYPYIQKTKIQLRNVILLPLKSPKFLATIMLMGLWSFATSLPAASWDYYLLNTIGSGITVANLFTPLYLFFLFTCTTGWRRFFRRNQWLKTFAYAALIHNFSEVICVFVDADNVVWMYTIVMTIRGFAGVGLNLANAGLPYLNLPPHDETNYIAFYTLFTTFSAFLGQLCGTGLVRLFGDLSFRVLDNTWGIVQILLLLCGFLHYLCAFIIFRKLDYLTPAKTPGN